jgi:hypothetical protein
LLDGDNREELLRRQDRGQGGSESGGSKLLCRLCDRLLRYQLRGLLR